MFKITLNFLKRKDDSLWYRKLIKEEVEYGKTLDEIGERFVKTIQFVKNKGKFSQIGFVSGIITSDGQDHIVANIKRLATYTKRVRGNLSYPIISATDMFTQEIIERIGGEKLTSQKWIHFWRRILKHSKITDIFMTPKWKRSKGAKDEHETAKKIGIKIHY